MCTHKTPRILIGALQFGEMNYGHHTPIFPLPDELEEIGCHKDESLDKTSHQLTTDYRTNAQQPQYTTDITPLKGSYFFTPTSPKPFAYDFCNTGEDSNPRCCKKEYNPPTTVSNCNGLQNSDIFESCEVNFQFQCSIPSISQRLNLEMEEENSQMADNYQSFSYSHLLPSKRSVPNRSSKNEKGLRNLSESVYMIASELATTKYKEVADRLISQIAADGKEAFQKKKDQHNIKRRVYDALNVLIAAGLLRKEGKDVACNEPYQAGKAKKSMKNTRQMMEKQLLQTELVKKQQALRMKQQKIQKLQHKKKLIDDIVKRNKTEPTPPSKILKFPLIGTILSSGKMEITNFQEQQLIVKTTQRPHLYGDVDLLAQISKNSIQANNLLNSICCPVKEQVKMEEP